MELSESLLADMAAKGIDAGLTIDILAKCNSGMYDGVKPVRATGVPSVDGRSVIALGSDARRSGAAFRIDSLTAMRNLERFSRLVPGEFLEAGRSAPRGVEVHTAASGRAELAFGVDALARLGAGLLPSTAYGVLNGGSATSYADRKKNLAFGEEVFRVLEPAFSRLAPLCRDRPKGLTPAYVNPDGSPGESFLALKMRARLLAAHAAGTRAGGSPTAFLPLFQMSSTSNDAVLGEAYQAFRESPLLAPLARRTGLDPAAWATGVQPMIAAFTHSSEGRPLGVFDRAHGKPDSAIALPGGHGQCFRILADVLRSLHAGGARYACIGNVDNIAYFPDPVEIGIMALSGMPAGFDFSLRTPIDVKGGILVETAGGMRTIADIGPAISFAEVEALESSGASILFNCASGIFDLDWLVPRLGDLASRLPVRLTDQDKDAGRYSQAEQVTWEVTGLLPEFMAFAVDKQERFIAAKLLAETLLTSGARKGDPRIPEGLAATSALLRGGLESVLRGACGMRLQDGRWQPVDPP